ncbi:hypothetical protein [Dactylosporangium darangshiense]|uniref:hypothetical protein n=1 Tax=Dactylosporangium darangshiense TaxID=579108 RepID=UPI003632383F
MRAHGEGGDDAADGRGELRAEVVEPLPAQRSLGDAGLVGHDEDRGPGETSEPPRDPGQHADAPAAVEGDLVPPIERQQRATQIEEVPRPSDGSTVADHNRLDLNLG